jgi:hypothetical protein
MARAPAEIAIVQPAAQSEARPAPASSQANELVRASGSPEASRRVTPDAMLTEGRKADGRSEFEQINVPDVAKAEPTLEQDDARFRIVRIHRAGAEPSVYRVPRER